MSGGPGADQFVFSDHYEMNWDHSVEVLAQAGTIKDFNPDEGDKIAINRVEDGAAPPEYVGHVESYFDVPVGGYGIVGDTLFVALVYDADINGYFTDGIKIKGIYDPGELLII